jgi:sugar lactone lactonase YvrE
MWQPESPDVWQLRAIASSHDEEPPAAVLSQPSFLAIDGGGNAYRSDGQTVVRIAADGRTTLAAGSPGLAGFRDGRGATARFSFASGLAFDPTSEEIVVWDAGNAAVRAIDKENVVRTRVFLPLGEGEAILPQKRRQPRGPLALDDKGTIWIGSNGGQGFRVGVQGRALIPISFPAPGIQSMAATDQQLFWKRENDPDLIRWQSGAPSSMLEVPLIDGKTRSVVAASPSGGALYLLDLREGHLFQSNNEGRSFDRISDELARWDDQCAARKRPAAGAFGLDDLALSPTGELYAVGRCLHVLSPDGSLIRSVVIRPPGRE